MSRPSGRGRGRPTGACSTTARPPTRRAARGASARSTSGGTPSKGRWTGYDVPDFPVTKAPGLPAAEGRRGHGRDQRRRPVHDDGGRPRLAVRAHRTARRAAADALRAARVAGAQPPVSGARRQPRRDPLAAPREPAAPGGRPTLSVRGDDLPADRASHRGRHEPQRSPGWASCSPRCSRRSTRCSPASAASRTAAG